MRNITPEAIEQAFASVPRAQFMPEDIQNLADFDEALPIGYGQTISQPSTVAEMLDWLDIEAGDHVLDIGSGSGWTTALLSHLVGPHGHIDAVELVPELVKFGRENCRRAGVKNATFHQASDRLGLPSHGPFDRILVSASPSMLPTVLLDQLKIGGKLVIPVQSDILEITKITKTKHDTRVHSGYVFVPLITP